MRLRFSFRLHGAVDPLESLLVPDINPPSFKYDENERASV
jgi:hypothetical protein